MASDESRRSSRVRAIAGTSAWWVSKQLAEHLMAAALMVFLVALGMGKPSLDDRVDEAAVVAAEQAGRDDLAQGYRAFARAKKDLQDAALERVPDVVAASPRLLSLGGAGLVLLVAVGIAVLRAPTRAHMLQAMGWGVAEPAVMTTLAALVLEWRAMKGLRATFSGKRDLDELLAEGKAGAVEAIGTLWPLLAGASVVLALGLALRRRALRRLVESGAGPRKGEAKTVEPFGPRAVLWRMLVIAGLVPFVHFAAAVLFDAFTKGSSMGASLAPWVEEPIVYLATGASFAFGIALWLLAWREARRHDTQDF